MAGQKPHEDRSWSLSHPMLSPASRAVPSGTEQINCVAQDLHIDRGNSLILKIRNTMKLEENIEEALICVTDFEKV